MSATPSPAPFATFDGERVNDLSLTIPSVGAWSADISLSSDSEITSAMAPLVVGDMVLQGTVVRSAAFGGSRRARIVGGSGRWQRQLSAREYSAPGGVLLGMVLRDAALELGERVVVSNDAPLGATFLREAGPGGRLLRLLAPAWWVDAAGSTRNAARPTSTVKSPFTVTAYDGARARFVIATEAIAEWVPGAVFTAPQVVGARTVNSMTVRSSRGRLRLEVLTGTGDRLLDALNELIRGELDELVYLRVWEYEVTAATATTFSGRPTTGRFPLPDVNDVPLRPSMGGATCVPQVESLVLVGFINGDPTRPYLHSYDSSLPVAATVDALGSVAIGATAPVTVLASGDGVVVREGDTIALLDPSPPHAPLVTGIVQLTVGQGVPPAFSRVRA